MRDCYWLIEEVKCLVYIIGDELGDLLFEGEILEWDVLYYICLVLLM